MRRWWMLWYRNKEIFRERWLLRWTLKEVWNVMWVLYFCFHAQRNQHFFHFLVHMLAAVYSDSMSSPPSLHLCRGRFFYIPKGAACTFLYQRSSAATSPSLTQLPGFFYTSRPSLKECTALPVRICSRCPVSRLTSANSDKWRKREEWARDSCLSE